ncbi:MAG TPA: GatB/YqeY domain-containing protein [Chloroflexia bacterium]|nr:GatB/YqeY domain-containing protein [Chloroflexia bacterium]
MTIEERLMNDLKDAMRAGAEGERRKSTIRMARAALKNAQIELQHPLSDDEAITVLQRQVKQRRDSIDEYEKAHREDLAQIEREEIAVLQAYLPQQMSADDVAAVVRATIAETGAQSLADLSKVMPVLMTRLKDKAEGRLINQIVRQQLQG